MLAKLAQFFKEPPVKETIQDGEKLKVCMLIGD